MQPQTGQASRKFRWGVPASVAVHALVIALVIFGLDLPLPERAPEPEAVDVEIVPPPEPQEAEPQEAEPQEAEPPEPEPAEQAEDEQPPPDATETAQALPPLQVLRPVFEFGERDAGPRVAEDGNAPEEEQPPPAEEPEPVETDEESDVAAAIPAEKPPEPLTEAKTLFSQSATEALSAMTAMNGMPRGERAGELCVTEMREQLRHAEPPFWPDLLPSYRLGEGTVIEVRQAAFRAEGRWYDLAFRCELDAEITRVVSFAFDVGGAIPREQWKARGFPAS